jgi:hypothetical protein
MSESSFYASPPPDGPTVCCDWPRALKRALHAKGRRFTVELRGGTLATFNRACDLGEGWVHLGGVEEVVTINDMNDSGFLQKDLFFRLGLEVRVSDLVWIAETEPTHED